jgi:endonuclease/exonuclease/phosphatase family metal-dependent hydrolase
MRKVFKPAQPLVNRSPRHFRSLVTYSKKQPPAPIIFGILLCLVVNACSSRPNGNVRLTYPVTNGGRVTFADKKPSVRFQEPEYLNYDELLELSKDPNPNPEVARKLEKFWRSPIISNEAWFDGKRPRHQSTPYLGALLRVASWNIEKSLTMAAVADAIRSPSAYINLIDPKKAPEGSPKRETMLRQRDRLATADIIFLQEMDIGVTRSHYIDAARTLAKSLGMNYAYAPQSLEVDPVQLGLEPRAGMPPVQPERYKGVFGSAILSRYPILKVETFQLKTQPYNWHTDESRRTDFVEGGRRMGSSIVFENEITRELKIGGRNFFRVDIAVPQVPGGVVTLINNHLEIKTRPRGRKAQMDEILSYLKDIPNPIIMAGDHNSAPDDLSSTSLVRVIWRQVDNPADFLRTTATVSDLFAGVVVPLYRERGVLNSIKNFQNPLAVNIPVFFPNKVRAMFKSVENHRQADGTAFDFRGDRERSINGRRGILANSNEKHFRGHSTSFSVRRPIGPLGRYRLDWFFVRSGYLKHPRAKHAPYRFAPHYGETLAAFNGGLTQRLSDHHPIIIDLPFNEPGQSPPP